MCYREVMAGGGSCGCRREFVSVGGSGSSGGGRCGSGGSLVSPPPSLGAQRRFLSVVL